MTHSEIVLGGQQSSEVVLGLHWDPLESGADRSAADLDAVCVLYGLRGEVKEAIHSGHPRSANGSVVHTGDCRTGASAWDDERIFVFLGALPEDIAELAFVVISAGRHSFDQIRGAVGHVSDRMSEKRWISVDLTMLAGRVTCTVATLRREATGWRILTEGRVLPTA